MDGAALTSSFGLFLPSYDLLTCLEVHHLAMDFCDLGCARVFFALRHNSLHSGRKEGGSVHRGRVFGQVGIVKQEIQFDFESVQIMKPCPGASVF